MRRAKTRDAPAAVGKRSSRVAHVARQPGVTPDAHAEPPAQTPRGQRPPATDGLGVVLQRAVESRARPRRGAVASGTALLQRRIATTLGAYAKGIGINDLTQLTLTQLGEYYRLAVLDDLNLVTANAQNTYAEDKAAEWNDLAEIIKSTKRRPMQERVDAMNALVASINAYFDTGFAGKVGWNELGEAVRERVEITNLETRYAQNPQKTWSHKSSDYSHTVATPRTPKVEWADDPDMRKKFGTALAGLGQPPQTINPRGPLTVKVSDTASKGARRPLIQLPWSDAKLLLPRPLINLIFDVRYQLESDDGTFIDERTPDERTRKVTTPNMPGTLRSWHSDAPKVLPDNTLVVDQTTYNKDNIPLWGTALHQHYRDTSAGGEGASQTSSTQATTPVGYAEYTGTGSNWEHNTKIVLDYISKRVYLTLTHYQYWAIITKQGGSHEFWESGTQEYDQADARLTDRLKNTTDTGQLMSPWIEIVMP